MWRSLTPRAEHRQRWKHKAGTWLNIAIFVNPQQWTPVMFMCLFKVCRGALSWKLAGTKRRRTTKHQRALAPRSHQRLQLVPLVQRIRTRTNVGHRRWVWSECRFHRHPLRENGLSVPDGGSPRPPAPGSRRREPTSAHRSRVHPGLGDLQTARGRLADWMESRRLGASSCPRGPLGLRCPLQRPLAAGRPLGLRRGAPQRLQKALQGRPLPQPAIQRSPPATSPRRSSRGSCKSGIWDTAITSLMPSPRSIMKSPRRSLSV